MPTSKELAIPLANYPSGTHVVSARNVPDWATHLSFEFERCTSGTPTLWPNASTTLDIGFELFVDGVWVNAGAFTDVGGISMDPDDEAERTISFGRVSLRAGSNRQFRATVNIGGGPLRTRGSVEYTG